MSERGRERERKREREKERDRQTEREMGADRDLLRRNRRISTICLRHIVFYLNPKP